MFYARLFFILCVTSVITTENESNTQEEIRSKRQINSIPLVFPYGATYKLLIGFSMPVPSDYSLFFSVNFQYQYLHFQNASQLSQYYFIKEVSREQRDVDILASKDEKLVFYRSIEDMMISKGMNGHDCLLRAICEMAQYPVEEEGLVGEILHILLTFVTAVLIDGIKARPDYGRTPFDDDDPDLKEDMAIYTDAAVAGRQMFDCGSVYSECPEGRGVLELISTLRDE